ncbi:hypothetical protein [Thiocystis violascens]|uniref:hypothetical protein n=1 Tax=Thiocystis violascens TaxID=73141 RepID=UPI00145FCA1E|nr:hypothetical protein [Thiocystis violascens]
MKRKKSQIRQVPKHLRNGAKWRAPLQAGMSNRRILSLMVAHWLLKEKRLR